MIKVSVGIDPGWKNFGLAITKWVESGEIQLVDCWVLCPAKYESIPAFIESLKNILPEKIDYVTMERFIAYKGVDSAEFEIINRLIGALTYFFYINYSSDLKLYRAIDWKMELVKSLFLKKGFDNPSEKLDKKFSMAAADACLDPDSQHGKIKTDHEADAICLSSTPKYLKGRL